ncbi:MAG: hypothetical protein IT343_06640 [Candidatus Melainabacteria bacterium]|nr:hypothetical protein [Candidatus Melainabacteria bacterium]
MAKLVSEDKEVESTLEIVPGPALPVAEIMSDQAWQKVGLALVSGPFNINLGYSNNNENGNGSDSAVEDDEEPDEECLFCRKPKDEVHELAEQIEQLIEGKLDSVLFEPAEPFFELRITKAPVFGFKVEAWLDSGNATTGVYRWDGVGIRMHTTRDNLASFTKQLRSEFSC